MLNRTIAPPSYKIKKPVFINPNEFEITQNIELYSTSMGTQNVVQLDMIFDSGALYETKPGVAYITGNMLLEGTKNKNFSELADIIDHYGANIEVKSGFDFLTISLSCLTVFLPRMLDILNEVLTEPLFDVERLEHLKSLKCQDLLMENSKTDRIAKKKLRSIIFSNEFAYGHILTDGDIENITIDDVKHYYSSIFFTNPKFFISGLYDERILESVVLWAKKFASNSFVKTNNQNRVIIPRQNISKENISIKDDPVQASICLGKIMPLKSSVDYPDISLVNTLLGGYFGSRLMKNIREVNGYTYGIYSNIVNMQHSSMLLIAADVADKYLDATLREIDLEIKKLQKEEVPKTELKTLKNYLMGMLKNEMDNPIAMMDRFKSTNLYGMDCSFYENLYESIYNLDEDLIHEISKEYFQLSSMFTVVAK